MPIFYKNLFLVALILINFQFISAKNQLNNTDIIEIESQKELEAFGKKKLSKFEGSLIIKNVSDLSPLATIIEIKGMLIIGNHTPDGIVQNPELTSLNGLQNLTKVGRHLSFHSNPKLENFDALKKLKYIGESIDIMDNKSLVSIKGLNNVTFIGKSINIWLNPKLKTIDTFYNIKEVKNRLSIYDNDSLQDISGFSNVKKIGNDLMIQENDALIELNGFDSLETIQNRLELKSNFYLLSVNTFKNLKNVGFIQMKNNTRLKKICGFRELKIPQDKSDIKYNYEDFTIINEMFDLSSCK